MSLSIPSTAGVAGTLGTLGSLIGVAPTNSTPARIIEVRAAPTARSCNMRTSTEDELSAHLKDHNTRAAADAGNAWGRYHTLLAWLS
ncbi:hypothetical protein DL764_009998 [Monosporascus ibericus]|uniref:Uncharacterized protein n=1 Tax=Monosporascus ibericus TaxID=155417 RepID=A0A4Q4SVI5_9PEZI|nr:hypothetical protein DL764_009998 [Monosporascus ibericus]